MDQGQSGADVIEGVTSENAGFTVSDTGMFPWVPLPPPGAG